MSIFFWKKNKQIDAFAHQLADELYSDIQPDMAAQYFGPAASEDSGKQRKKSADMEKRVTRRLGDIATKIQQYRVTHSLGIYGKARLHLTFTERLQELGYSQDITKQLNQILLLKTP